MRDQKQRPKSIVGRVIAALIICPVLTLGGAPSMLSAQTEGPIELSADRAEVNDATGISRYFGNVILTRDNLKITGETLFVYTNEARELRRIEVRGTPATFLERLPNAEDRQAEAPQMEYYASGPERIVLLDGGHLWQGDNRVRGETITHYPAEGKTLADTDTASDDRVEVTVFPEDEDEP